MRVAAIASLLMLTAYTGLVDGSSGLRSALTPGERATIGTQLAYGVCSVAALVAMFVRRRWVFPILVAWGLALTVTGGLAPVVFGGTNVWIGVAGGASVAAVVALVLWGWRKHTAPAPSGA